MTAGVGAQPIAGARSISLGAMIQRFLPIVIVALVFGVAAWAVTPYPVGVFHDDGVYLILAKALATGHGYRYLHLPGTPLATHYPPLYPALLALLWKIAPNFPGNISLLLLVNAMLLASAAWSLWRFTRDRLGWPEWAAALVATVGTLSLPLLFLSTLVMSEVLCIALTIPLLSANESALNDERRTPVSRASLGAATGLLALVRAHAIALPLGVVLLLLARRRWSRAGWYALGVSIVIAPWQLWIALHDDALSGALHGSYGSYVGWFGDGLSRGGLSFLWHTATTNLVEVVSLLADRVAPWPTGWMRIAPLLLALGVIVAGAVRLRRRAPVTLSFLGIYVAAMLVWPYAPWRFLWAIWPLVLIVLAEGAWATFERATAVPIAGMRGLALLCTALIALGITRAEIESYSQRTWRAPVQVAQHQIAPLVRWAAMNTQPNDLLLADDEPLVYLMTGRSALPPASFTALEYVRPDLAADSTAVRVLRGLLQRYPAHYLLTVVPSTRAAARIISSNAAERPTLREIEGLGTGGAVFEVVR
jgi:hypothetical protein